MLCACAMAESEEALRAALAHLGEHGLRGRLFRRDENRNVALVGLTEERLLVLWSLRRYRTRGCLESDL